MNTLRHARHLAGLQFAVVKIIIPTVLLLGVTFLVTLTPLLTEILGNSKDFFLLTILALAGVMIFIIAPLAYGIARNNSKLVRAVLKDIVARKEDMLQMFEEYLADIKQNIRDLSANRKIFFDAIWSEHNRTCTSNLESYIRRRIVQLQEIINSSTAQEMARHQDYFLTLKKILHQLEDIRNVIPKDVPEELPADSYKILCDKTQASFETQVRVYEKYANDLRNTIGILQREITEARQFLNQVAT